MCAYVLCLYVNVCVCLYSVCMCARMNASVCVCVCCKRHYVNAQSIFIFFSFDSKTSRCEAERRVRAQRIDCQYLLTLDSDRNLGQFFYHLSYGLLRLGMFTFVD
jgi:hypothetical protein